MTAGRVPGTPDSSIPGIWGMDRRLRTFASGHDFRLLKARNRDSRQGTTFSRAVKSRFSCILSFRAGFSPRGICFSQCCAFSTTGHPTDPLPAELLRFRQRLPLRRRGRLRTTHLT